MRETRADSTQAVVLAIALHAFLFALMFVGLWWTRDAAPIAAAGSPISAEMVDTDELSSQMRRALARDAQPLPEPEPEPPLPQPVEEDTQPLPQPLPEPVPEESPVPRQQEAQDFIPEPAPVEQEKVDRDAISAETRAREQEEKRRQEQIDLTERKKQEEAEEKKRLAEQQRDERLKKLQAERAKAEREAKLAEQKLKQIADARAQKASDDAAASASPPPGNNGVDAGLQARYAAAIQEAVLRNWTRPENVPLGQRCRIYITQLPGGDVMSAKVDPSCPYDELGRRSVEAAVLKAKPLPYAGFESVFQRNLILNFQAQDR
ncbi:MAG TPA: cell envelope integrity protein TolA [Luteimonas sp.]|nr:cell envelope integrity protein TolA [Luteimonas sp.]